MMNGGLALLLLVVVAGLAECAPTVDLRGQLEARVAELRAKGKGQGGDRKGGKGDKGGKGGKGGKEEDWPYGWIEFASLVGKCEENRNWLEILNITEPMGGVLAEACPKAYDACEKLLNATDEDLVKATGFMNKVFPLLQCANLQAEKEALAFALMVNQKDIAEDIYLKETEELFNLCEKVFESAEEQANELDKDLDKIEELEEASKQEETRDAEIRALLRQLLNAAAKRR